MEVVKMGKITLSKEDIQIIDKFHGLLYRLIEILGRNEVYSLYNGSSGEKIVSTDELENLMTEIELKTSPKEFYFYLN